MSSNFIDYTNYLTSGVITLSPNQSVPSRTSSHDDVFVAAQPVQSAGPYIVRGNSLPFHPCPPPQCFDRQSVDFQATSYEPQQLLVRKFGTDMDLDLDHQRYHTAMRGDIAPGTSESGFATAGHLRPVYRVANCHTLTSTYNPEPRPLINVQPSYYPGNLAVGTVHQSPTMALANLTSANYYLALDENTSNPTFTNAYNKGTAQEVLGASGLAAANHLKPVHKAANCHNLTSTYNTELRVRPLFSAGVFINNVQPSYYPSNLAVGSIQQPPTMALADPTSANYDLTLDTNTNSPTTFTNAYSGGSERSPSHDDEVTSANPNGKESLMYRPVYDGNTVRWHCNLSGCQYVSRSKRDMERHCSNLRHGGSREHKCEFCGNAFLRKDTLKRHVRETRCQLRQVAQPKNPEDDLL